MLSQFFYKLVLLFLICLGLGGCSHGEKKVDLKQAARLDPKLVRETIVFEPGSEKGAVVPEISAPRLRAIWVSERIENGRLIEAHREWQVEGDVVLLGIPSSQKSASSTAVPPGGHP